MTGQNFIACQKGGPRTLQCSVGEVIKIDSGFFGRQSPTQYVSNELIVVQVYLVIPTQHTANESTPNHCFTLSFVWKALLQTTMNQMKRWLYISFLTFSMYTTIGNSTSSRHLRFNEVETSCKASWSAIHKSCKLNSIIMENELEINK